MELKYQNNPVYTESTRVVKELKLDNRKKKKKKKKKKGNLRQSILYLILL